MKAIEAEYAYVKQNPTILEKLDNKKSGQSNSNWPKYLISVDGNKKFTTKQDAGMSLDSLFCKVELLSFVLYEDFTVSLISDQEYNEIIEISDNYSASK